MHYTVRHFDLPLLEFEADMDSAETNLRIVKVYDENRAFLPLNLTVSEDGLGRWLRHRTIPKNRAYVDALLSKVGLSLNRPLGIITVCKGLSLNDCFWVDAEGCWQPLHLPVTAAACGHRWRPARSSRPTECCRNAGGG